MAAASNLTPLSIVRDPRSAGPAPEAGSVIVLKHIYRDELLAVRTYELALRETTLSEAMQRDLRACQASHRDRVLAIEQRLLHRGAECPDSSGAPGILVTLLEGAAVNLSEQTALDLLRQWETEQLADYQTRHPVLDRSDAEFVIGELLPAQVASHRILVRLSERMHGRGSILPSIVQK